MIRKRKNTAASSKKIDTEEPEISSAEGSGAQERLRAAEYEEGRGPAREGADADRNQVRSDPRATRG